MEALWTGAPIADLTEPLIGLHEPQRDIALIRLQDAKLLTINRNPATGVLISLDAHPLLREYFATRLRESQPAAWQAAHQRLYEHLCATTKEGDKPTLEDLQPLYQAVAHGCQAGMQQEACDKVYYARIKHGSAHYSTRKLGALGSDLGAITYFFDEPWKRASSREEAQYAFTSTASHLDSAVTGLLAAGTQEHLPRGLLTRAWLRSITGPLTGHDSAQSDLDEAWEIAQRGPMPLFMADAHLYRARLFLNADQYPWESPQADLAEARRLIEKHGYWRRLTTRMAREDSDG